MPMSATAPADGPRSRHCYAMVCYSNMNRSMEAHRLVAEAGLRVRSFGTGTTVRLPGESSTTPNVYAFGTPYRDILQDLTAKNQAHYFRRGLLGMAERNLGLKHSPERWQDAPSVVGIDVVFCFQERVFDAVVEDLECRDPVDAHPIHVVNLDVVDNAEEAAKGAVLAQDFCVMCEQVPDLELGMGKVLAEFYAKHGQQLLYSMHFL